MLFQVYYNDSYYGPILKITNNDQQLHKVTNNTINFKKYNSKKKITQLRKEFEQLQSEKYTHIKNMNADWLTICYYCRLYNIIPLDDKILRSINHLISVNN